MFVGFKMNFSTNLIRGSLITLIILMAEVYAKPMDTTRESSRLSKPWESDEGELEDSMDGYIAVAPVRLIRRSALDSDIFGTTYRWRKRRMPH